MDIYLSLECESQESFPSVQTVGLWCPVHPRSFLGKEPTRKLAMVRGSLRSEQVMLTQTND